MKIATITASAKDARFSTLTNTHYIDGYVTNKAKIHNPQQVQDRGVLAYTTSKSVLNQGINTILSCMNVNGRLGEDKNKIYLRPDYDNCNGYILYIKPLCDHQDSLIIQFHQPKSNKIVVSNHTNIECRHDKSNLGTLIVVHCDESEEVELEYTLAYTSEYFTNGLIQRGKVTILDNKNICSLDNRFIFDGTSYMNLEPGHMQYIVQSNDNNLQEAWSECQNPELKELKHAIYLETQHSRSSQKQLYGTNEIIL